MISPAGGEFVDGGGTYETEGRRDLGGCEVLTGVGVAHAGAAGTVDEAGAPWVEAEAAGVGMAGYSWRLAMGGEGRLFLVAEVVRFPGLAGLGRGR